MPIHDSHKIDESMSHPYIGYICTPINKFNNMDNVDQNKVYLRASAPFETSS